jgi:EAL domain-containing protein (putative c-di-GMP-specific phosphodiesterase class I)
VRVHTPDGQLVPAAQFMPAIERLGLAPLIDRRVLAMAFDALAEHADSRLSVNIFPQTMQDAAWLGLFHERVRARPDLADRLIVEVTETAAMLDPERTARFMESLRTTGAAFALDDFGAGHSSFRNLRRFRFDMVKLDGTFIEDIETDLDDRFFVRLLADIADRFEMMAVAESVRRPAQARILRDLGIQYFQGFHFGAPDLRLVRGARPPSLLAEI